MKEKLQKLTQHKFFRAILTLFSGSLIGQLVSVASSLFTSRLFTDYEIGIYTLMTTAVTLFSSIACLKYEPSIVTRHLVDIAQAFNKFYHDEHILVDDEDEKPKALRPFLFN